MRILIVGAGAIGGYFGGRLIEAGREVTFLVRPARAELLARNGLVVKSRLGDIEIPAPKTVTADALREPYDLIILSCKAYDLAGAMDSLAGGVGPETMILPLLNGMAHLEALEARFGARAVLGGQCVISTVLDPEGRILHLNEAHSLTFGERDGGVSARIEAVAAAFRGAGFDANLSRSILQDMWDKWVFIATAAGITCLMRSAVGDIVAGGGAQTATGLLAECAAIARKHGFPTGDAALERSRSMFTTAGSGLTASMLRDIERGGAIESDQIIGDLLRRGEGQALPLLHLVLVHLKAYEARRAREAKLA